MSPTIQTPTLTPTYNVPRTTLIMSMSKSVNPFRDPDLDYLRSVIRSRGLSPGDIIDLILDTSPATRPITYRTLERWISGKIRWPQNKNLTLVARALGLTRTWTLTPED